MAATHQNRYYRNPADPPLIRTGEKRCGRPRKTTQKSVTLNMAERLILTDIDGHPGTTQAEIVQRLAPHYRRSFIRDSLHRLVSIGLLTIQSPGDDPRQTTLSSLF